jgi:hypothetical protein
MLPGSRRIGWRDRRSSLETRPLRPFGPLPPQAGEEVRAAEKPLQPHIFSERVFGSFPVLPKLCGKQIGKLSDTSLTQPYWSRPDGGRSRDVRTQDVGALVGVAASIGDWDTCPSSPRASQSQLERVRAANLLLKRACEAASGARRNERCGDGLRGKKPEGPGRRSDVRPDARNRRTEWS